MIRHISVFLFRDCPAKEQTIRAVEEFLAKVPEQYPPMRSQQVARSAAITPNPPDDAPVAFGDLIQVAEFDTLADSDGYPLSAVHAELSAFSSAMMKKVIVMDYEL